MKHLFIFAAAAAILAACAAPSYPAHFYESTRTSEWPMAPAFDWNAVDSIVVIDRSVNDNTLAFRSCWDPDSLYLRFEVEDTDLQAFVTERDGTYLFLDDMVEFLLDPRMDRDTLWVEDDIIYHINILGYTKDDRGTPEGRSDMHWTGAARWNVDVFGSICDSTDVDRGYNLTVAVPWGEIGRNPAPGLEMGLNFAVDDNEGHCERMMYNWTGAAKMRDPSKFGILKLR